MEVIFNLAEPFRQYDDDGSFQRQPLVLLIGQMRRYMLIEPTGTVRILGVRFWPGGAYPFITLPQHELADNVFGLDAVWGGIVPEIESRLRDARTTAELVSLIESLLLARLNQFRAPDEAVLAAVALIFRSGGLMSIGTLADEMGMSLRQLDRRFNSRVGLTPKALCRIIRLQRLLKMLEHKGSPEWARLALECGYYDQSHLIKEFRAFAGKEPTSYFSEPNVMSEHFTLSS
jgi:AraC-like DNA-binding protein